MKKIFLMATCSLFLFGCNMSPNKEARIQKLEAEMQKTVDKIDELERKVQSLEGVNEGLERRILELKE